MFRYFEDFDISTFQYFVVSIFRYFDFDISISIILHFDVLIFRRSSYFDISMFRCFDICVRMFRFNVLRYSQCACSSIFRYFDVSRFRYFDVDISQSVGKRASKNSKVQC